MSQFDADALERAAKAARELEGSKNVKALLELSKREAEVKKAVEERKAAEANAQKAGYAKEQEAIRWEEQRKTLQYNKQMQQVRKILGELAVCGARAVCHWPACHSHNYGGSWCDCRVAGGECERALLPSPGIGEPASVLPLTATFPCCLIYSRVPSLSPFHCDNLAL